MPSITNKVHRIEQIRCRKFFKPSLGRNNCMPAKFRVMNSMQMSQENSLLVREYNQLKSAVRCYINTFQNSVPFLTKARGNVICLLTQKPRAKLLTDD